MIFARTFIVAVALGTLVAASAVAQESAPTTGRSIATRVPLKSRSGKPILLGSRVRPGKPTLISIWSSWCLPCVAEAPYLDKLRKELGGGFTFIYVNRMEGDPDPNQPPEMTARFLANAGMSDVDYVTADIAASRRILGVDVASVPEGKVGVPRIYLFDRNGRQVYTSYGFLPDNAAELDSRVREAMVK
jgi:thiol-disulfide isomerase/thioredoxin